MEKEKDISLNIGCIEIKNLLVCKKFKEAENKVKIELIKKDKKIDAQLWVYLGEALMHQGFGKAASKVFNRAWLLDPNAQWVESIKGVLENVKQGSEKEDIDKLLEVPKATVTAGIIVKNEERCIEKCIKALINAVDEILLIDTGSTDRTIEIAKEYKQVKIVQFNWCDDFAAARNFGLNSIKTDWVIWIDADEELVVEDINSIRVAAGIFNDFDEPWLIRIGILNKVGDMIVQNFDVNRMFKMSFEIKFEGIIHEQLYLPDKLPSRTIPMRIRVKHDGYDNEIMKSKGTLQRNLKLLKKLVEMNPDDAGSLLFYGRELFVQGELGKSEEVLLKAEAVGMVAKDSKMFGRLLEIYDLLIAIYIDKNEIDKVEEISKKALEENEDYPNARFYLANIQAQKAMSLLYEAGENTKRAKAGFLKYRGLVSPNNQILDWQADLLLADLKRNTGDFCSALKYYKRLEENKICGSAVTKHIESIKSQVRKVNEMIEGEAKDA